MYNNIIILQAKNSQLFIIENILHYKAILLKKKGLKITIIIIIFKTTNNDNNTNEKLSEIPKLIKSREKYHK